MGDLSAMKKARIQVTGDLTHTNGLIVKGKQYGSRVSMSSNAYGAALFFFTAQALRGETSLL